MAAEAADTPAQSPQDLRKAMAARSRPSRVSGQGLTYQFRIYAWQCRPSP
ncbi:hypothetical protein ACWFMI_24400 [Nocardiopsis terrae]